MPAKLRGQPAALDPAKPSKPHLSGHTAPNAAGAGCTTADFANRSGNDLVSYIKTVDWSSCINPLFSLTGADAHAVFNQSQMLAVANGITSAAGSYTGDDSGGLYELMYFMRAGYYVQYGDPQDVGTYDSSLRTAIEKGFDALFAGSHAND
ncbi:M9 family metallopeptidase N-terminal domain-containing protein, partial [Streptomyces griseofuscus]